MTHLRSHTVSKRNDTTGPVIARVLILGHSGFIGNHLQRAFRTHCPDIELIGSSDSAVDLTRESEAERLSDLLDMKTAVVMCAGIKRQLGDTLDSFSRNVQMAVNLCRLLQRRPVQRLVFFSSAAVYGEEIHNTNVTELTPVQPTSYYGAAKYASECLLEKTMRLHGESSLLILRPPVIYGPGDLSGAYGPSGFVRSALDGEAVTLWGDGLERREFVFVEDVADIVRRLTFDHYFGCVNVASSRSYSYVDILDILSRELPGSIATASRPRSKARVDHGFCNTGLKELLPDFSFTPLDAGVRRLIDANRP